VPRACPAGRLRLLGNLEMPPGATRAASSGFHVNHLYVKDRRNHPAASNERLKSGHKPVGRARAFARACSCSQLVASGSAATAGASRSR